MHLELAQGGKTFLVQQPCVHQHDECNGCPLMQLPYSKQLELKGSELNGLFGREVKIEPSANPLGYRNKAELSYVNGLLGYKRKGNFYESFKLEECLLMSKEANVEIQKISAMLAANKIPDADIMKRRMGLGYVVYRENSCHQGLANFVFFGAADEKFQKECAGLLGGNLAGIGISLNETWSDTSYGQTRHTFGLQNVEEQILGKKFEVGFNTFFQTNVQSAQKIFSKVVEQIPNGAKCLDLYCGVGTISLAVAEKCERVVGIELNRESINSAIENARRNKITNAYFVCGGAEEKLKEVGGFDVIILDPPRSGITKKAGIAILEQSPQKIIYVSCNPKTLALDLKHFSGYKITNLEAFDQFAQTHHMELLCVLEKEVL